MFSTLWFISGSAKHAPRHTLQFLLLLLLQNIHFILPEINTKQYADDTFFLFNVR